MSTRDRLRGVLRSPVRSERASASAVVAALSTSFRPDSTERVTILLDRVDSRLADAVRQHLPSAVVNPVVVNADSGQAVAAIRAAPPSTAMVDATTRGNRLKLLRQTFWALPDGALYVIVNPDRSWSDDVDSLRTPRDQESAAAARRREELVTSMEVMPGSNGLGVVRKRGTHHFTLRHDEVEQVLAERFAAGWGEVIARRPARTFESRADLVMHGSPAPRDKQRVIAVPELSLRRYHDVSCHVREIVSRENLILPDTYRHWQSKRLFHKRVVPATLAFGRLDDAMQRARVRREPGEFFTFDSAFPTHYGHLMTETLSKFWGWKLAREQNPDLRIVMTHQPKKHRLPTWKVDVLGALGLPLDQILWVTEEESVRVDSLVSAMPQLENPHYVDPDLRHTWEALYAGLGPDPQPNDRPEKIFVSRRTRTQRWCTNTPEVEDFMAEQGYAVIYPETVPYAEQAHMFRAARVIAGFAGSGLFNAMLNPDAKVIVLSSNSYVAANEYLFASAAGHELHYFWTEPLVDQPDAGFSVEAYRSDFRFDLGEHRASLLAALA